MGEDLMKRKLIALCLLPILAFAQWEMDFDELWATAGGESFSPLSVPGCILWLDGYDTSTITLSNNYATAWRDKSAMGYSAFQPKVGLRAVSENGCLEFTADTYRITNFISPLSITVFVAMKRTAGSDWFIELGSNANLIPGWYMYGQENKSCFFSDHESNYDSRQAKPNWIPSGTNCVAFVRHGITEKLIESGVINGVTNAGVFTLAIQAEASVTNQLNIGSRNQSGFLYTGRIYEILVYGRCLTDSEFVRVSNYIGGRQRAE